MIEPERIIKIVSECFGVKVNDVNGKIVEYSFNTYIWHIAGRKKT